MGKVLQNLESKRGKVLINNPETVLEDILLLKEFYQQSSFSSADNSIIEKLINTLEKDCRYFITNLNADPTSFYTRYSGSYTKLMLMLENGRLTYDSELMSVQPAEQIKLFVKYSKKFSDKEYWTNLREAYISQFYQHIDQALYYKLFSAKRSGKEYLMNDSERAYLEKLPSQITIYRGGSSREEVSGKFGISWTLSRKVAEKFVFLKSKQTGEDMIVFTKEIDKKLVIAYIEERKEQEVLYIHKVKLF
jgi:hypothetical protein